MRRMIFSLIMVWASSFGMDSAALADTSAPVGNIYFRYLDIVSLCEPDLNSSSYPNFKRCTPADPNATIRYPTCEDPMDYPTYGYASYPSAVISMSPPAQVSQVSRTGSAFGPLDTTGWIPAMVRTYRTCYETSSILPYVAPPNLPNPPVAPGIKVNATTRTQK